MTAIAVAHHVPYVAQASRALAGLEQKVGRAAAADGRPSSTSSPTARVGWGHEPRLAPDARRGRRHALLAALRGRSTARTA